MKSANNKQKLLFSYLGFSQVPQSKVQSAQVVENFGGNVGLHRLLQDASGCAVSRQSALDVSLLQDLGELNPRLHIIWVLLCYLFEVTLNNQKGIRLTFESLKLKNNVNVS